MDDWDTMTGASRESHGDNKNKNMVRLRPPSSLPAWSNVINVLILRILCM